MTLTIDELKLLHNELIRLQTSPSSITPDVMATLLDNMANALQARGIALAATANDVSTISGANYSFVLLPSVGIYWYNPTATAPADSFRFFNEARGIGRWQLASQFLAISNHFSNTSNPHAVTKSQVGLSNVDNTSDISKPISSATQTALDDKANFSDLVQHMINNGNPHNVTKTQVGLSEVDNTSDFGKPISFAQQNALNNISQQVSTNTNDIAALRGAFIYRGKINLTYAQVTSTALTNRILELLSRAPQLADVLIDNNNYEWYYNGTTWDSFSPAAVGTANAQTLGIVQSSDDIYFENGIGTIQEAALATKNITSDMPASRDNLNASETIANAFGKIRKWFSSLANVAFSGSYTDLTNKPADSSLQSVTTVGNTTPNILQITSSVKVPTGSGLELFFGGTPASGYVQAMNRTSGVNLPLRLNGADGAGGAYKSLVLDGDITYNNKRVWVQDSPHATSSVIQATSADNIPTTGAGAEMYFSSGSAIFRGYDRSGGVNKPVQILGGSNATSHNLIVSDTLTYDGMPVLYLKQPVTVSISGSTNSYTPLGIYNSFDVNAASSSIALTIDLATLPLGAIVNVKKIDSSANSVTVNVAAGNNIEGVTSKSITGQWTNMTFQKVSATTLYIR